MNTDASDRPHTPRSMTSKRISVELDPLLNVEGGKFELVIHKDTTAGYLLSKALSFYDELPQEGYVYQLFPCGHPLPFEDHDLLCITPYVSKMKH